MYKINLGKTIPFEVQDLIRKLVDAALQAVNPYELVRNAIKVETDKLILGNTAYSKGEFNKIFCISIGKAAYEMARGAYAVLGGDISSSIVVSKAAPESSVLPESALLLQGGHPVPDERSATAGNAIMEFAQQIQPDDLCIFLISGGGSALVTSPETPLELQDIQWMTSELLKLSASIQELNTIRRAMDRLKGGGLAFATQSRIQASLILSDVIGDSLESIASGMTLPSAKPGREEVLNLIEYYFRVDQLPERIKKWSQNYLPTQKATIIETAGSKQHEIIGNNQTAILAWNTKAEELGWQVELASEPLLGDLSMATDKIASAIHAWEQKRLNTPRMMIWGGETTVNLGQVQGIGGRNLELALRMAPILSNKPGFNLLTFATDGEDGNSPFAGAWIDGKTMQILPKADWEEAINTHNSANYLNRAGLTIKTGSTGTNVNDLTVLYQET